VAQGTISSANNLLNGLTLYCQSGHIAKVAGASPSGLFRTSLGSAESQQRV
jgi:hypothetical protein